QERHPVRSEPADGRQRDSDRHARRHDARNGRERNGSRRRAHRPRPRVGRQRDRARAREDGSRIALRAVPVVLKIGAAEAAPYCSTVEFDPAEPAVDLIEEVAVVFASDGPLASVVPDFEPRDAQRQMASAVADALGDGGVLLAEAGTGTGKTLAYLVPAILSRRRVLVSTGTKNLQEQIVEKDLPVLAEAIDRPFTATVMKGRGN